MNNFNNLEKPLSIIFSILFSLNVHALEFYSLNYQVKEGDTFARIIKKFVKLDSIINSRSPMIHKTRSENSKSINWKDLRAGQKIKLIVTSDVIDKKKVDTYLKKEKELREELKRAKQASKEKKLKYSFGSLFGQVKIKQSSKELSMNFVKLAANIKYQTKSKYGLTGSVSLAKFLSISHSDSSKTSSSGIVPEFGFGIGRNLGKIYLTLGYDMLNYYLASSLAGSISLKSALVHRLALKPFYQIGKSIGVFGGLGYLKSFGSEGIGGYDLTLGSSYFFGKKKQLSLSPLLYISNLSTNTSSENDSSSAWLLSFSVSF